MLTIYTDGCCLGNPGIGGWAAIFTKNDLLLDIHYGNLGNTTNNKAELLALKAALEKVEKGTPVIIVTDSKNLIGWLSQGWKRKDPYIKEILEEIEVLIKERKLEVSYTHVLGHKGNKYNEMADTYAKKGAELS